MCGRSRSSSVTCQWASWATFVSDGLESDEQQSKLETWLDITGSPFKNFNKGQRQTQPTSFILFNFFFVWKVFGFNTFTFYVARRDCRAAPRKIIMFSQWPPLSRKKNVCKHTYQLNICVLLALRHKTQYLIIWEGSSARLRNKSYCPKCQPTGFWSVTIEANRGTQIRKSNQELSVIFFYFTRVY